MRPVAQAVAGVGPSLVPPTSSGTNQNLRALRESKAQVIRRRRKILLELGCDCFPLLLFWNYLKEEYWQCLRDAGVVFVL